MKEQDSPLSLGTDNLASLLKRYAMPSIIAMVSSSLYNMIDSIFIGHGVGPMAISGLALTMPLMAPLADIAGVTRQVAVLAFQLGDGFTNLIVPTSAVMMASIGAARIDWATWAKWQIKFQGVLFLFGSIFVIAAVMIGFN